MVMWRNILRQLPVVIVVLFLLANTGCNSAKINNTNSVGDTNSIKSSIGVVQDSTQNDNSKLQTNKSLDESKKKLAQKLLQELEGYVKKVDEHETSLKNATDRSESQSILANAYYDYLMASDRAKGIANLKEFLPEEKIKWVSDKQKNINQKLTSLNVPVYTGYSKSSGIHLMAITKPKDNSGAAFRTAIDKIRGEKEAFLMDSFDSESGLGNFEIFDLYVEDLLEQKSSFNIKMSILDKGTNYESVSQLDGVFSGAASVLRENKRDFETNELIQNKKWKMYIFNAMFQQPVIKVKVGNEEIVLTNKNQ